VGQVNPSTPQLKGRALFSTQAQAEGLRVDPEPRSFTLSSKTGLGAVERVKELRTAAQERVMICIDE